MKYLAISFAGVCLLAMVTAVGCGQRAPAPGAGSKPATPPSTAHGVAGHAHGTGPHGGTLADWGGGAYHVEFTVDHDKQEATVYVLGTDEKTAAAIKADAISLAIADPPIQATLKASPQAGDPAGTASRFVGNHPNLGKVQEYAGTISGLVDGTPYTGDFKEEPAK